MLAGVAETLRDLVGGIPPDERLAGYLMAAGVALVSLILLRRIWRRGRVARQSANDRRGLGPSGAHASPRSAIDPRGREALETLMVEVQELTRLCAAQMENRAARLEKLIREADERIARLQDLEDVHAPAPRPARTRADEAHRFVQRGGAPGAEPSPGSLLVEHDTDPLTRRVYTLADQGLTPVEIAGRLEEGVGKVELILALRTH